MVKWAASWRHNNHSLLSCKRPHAWQASLKESWRWPLTVRRFSNEVAPIWKSDQYWVIYIYNKQSHLWPQWAKDTSRMPLQQWQEWNTCAQWPCIFDGLSTQHVACSTQISWESPSRDGHVLQQWSDQGPDLPWTIQAAEYPWHYQSPLASGPQHERQHFAVLANGLKDNI